MANPEKGGSVNAVAALQEKVEYIDKAIIRGEEKIEMLSVEMAVLQEDRNQLIASKIDMLGAIDTLEAA